jgi:predicted amidophosphoribosyltransferase
MKDSPPDRLKWIDEASRPEHWALGRDDHCLFFGEYFPGGGWRAGATNDLVLDFKRTPASIRASPHPAALRYFKRRAIESVADALRRGFGRAAVESLLTFVPVPTSMPRGDADYCDRLTVALRRAFAGWDADVRPLLRVRAAVAPDHVRGRRLSRRELMRIMEVDGPQLDRPLRPVVVLFDDVLTSGKHLSVAKACIEARVPEQTVIAVCVARVARTDGVRTPIARDA